MNIDSVALCLISLFEACGHEAYAVGGCVRDALMGKTCNDTDITVSCTPDVTVSVLEKNGIRYVETGLKHGTVTAVVNHLPYEITTFRTDGEYTDNRRPDSVQFVLNLEDDLARRDFTVNAMAYSKKTGLVDKFHGREDLHGKIIRTVGDADTRFNEDALRILRALRFSSVLRFEIEEKTAQSILKNAPLLKNIARERITAELEKLLVGEDAILVLSRFESVFCQILGVEKLDLAPLYRLPPDFALRLAALSDGRTLVLSKVTASRIKTVRENVALDIPCDKASVCRALYKYSKDNLFDILVFNNQTDVLELASKILSTDEVYEISQLDINGSDLVSCGFSGADIKKALETALFAIIDKKIPNNRKKILDYLSHVC